VLIWNKACDRLIAVSANEGVGAADGWRAFYGERRSCLADLVLGRRLNEIGDPYASGGNWALSDFGVSAENWRIMPKVGRRLCLAIEAGPIYGISGRLIAMVGTLRDITVQKQAQIDLEALAARDGPMGPANGQSFDTRLTEQVKRAARDQSPLSLAMTRMERL
jgi:hypothetical protein